jgi:aspartate aminotransferase-like enzyme
MFRIGHLGDLNEPMLLGALTAVEMALRINNVPHGAAAWTRRWTTWRLNDRADTVER